MKKLSQLGDNINAFKLQFDDNLLDEIRASYREKLETFLTSPENLSMYDGGTHFDHPVKQADNDYYLSSFGTYPLLWLACNSQDTYNLYKSFFDNLGIEDEVKELIDHDEKIIMYCGFLVVCNQANDYSWHVDYRRGANAYTLITPLFELDEDHGNLLYKISEEDIQKHHYKLNEAIIFGDKFSHSTEPFSKSGKIRILLSFTFGTDKLKYWPILKLTVGDQSDFLMLPCGHRFGTCDCLEDIAEDIVPLNRNAPCYCGSRKKYKHCHGQLS